MSQPVPWTRSVMTALSMTAAVVLSAGTTLAESSGRGAAGGPEGLSSSGPQPKPCVDCELEDDGFGSAPDRRKDDATCSSPAQSSTMTYELEGIDLDSGTVSEFDFMLGFGPEVDAYFAYNADTPTHLRVFATFPAMLAILPGVPFESVSCDDARAASFSEMSADVDVPVTPGDTVLLMTAEGHTYKLGNATEFADMTVDFDFARLCAPCETPGPGTSVTD